MDSLPHITVAAIIESNQQFLLIEEESDGLIVLNQPAGHVELGETLIEAVIRETLEESAWHFIPESVVGIYQHKSTVNGIHYIRIAFHGRHHSYQADRPLDTGILRTLWLTRHDIAHHQPVRSPMVLQGIDDFLAGQRYPLSIFKSFLSNS